MRALCFLKDPKSYKLSVSYIKNNLEAWTAYSNFKILLKWWTVFPPLMEHSVIFIFIVQYFCLWRKPSEVTRSTKYTVWVVLLSLSSGCILPVSVVELKLNKCSISIFSEYWNEWIRSLFYFLCVSSVNFLEVWVCCSCLNQFSKQTFVEQNLL